MVLLGNVACGPQVYVRNHAERELRRRAAFETGCPADQLSLTPLSSAMGVESRDRSTDTPRTMGVSGCGKRGIYVYVAGQGYVLNAASHKAHTDP